MYLFVQTIISLVCDTNTIAATEPERLALYILLLQLNRPEDLCRQ